MCVPVVKPRWRVRHWSAPDRIITPSSTENLHGHDPNSEQVNIDGFAITGRETTEESDIICDRFIFSSDTVDTFSEITSSFISYTKPCKGDNMLPFNDSEYPTYIVNGNTRIGEESRVGGNQEEQLEIRSQEEVNFDERVNHEEESRETFQEHFTNALNENIAERDNINQRTRKRHESCPLLLTGDVSMKDQTCVEKSFKQSPPLPVQSMVLMLLLHRRQKLQDILPEINTARRNLSTARMSTANQRPAPCAPRHHRELRKLKFLFPHHYKNPLFIYKNNLNPFLFPKAISLPQLNGLSPAHDFQVPESSNIKDLEHTSFQNMQRNMYLSKHFQFIANRNERTNKTSSSAANDLSLKNQKSISTTSSSYLLDGHNATQLNQISRIHESSHTKLQGSKVNDDIYMASELTQGRKPPISSEQLQTYSSHIDGRNRISLVTKEELEMSNPTQTVHMANSASSPCINMSGRLSNESHRSSYQPSCRSSPLSHTHYDSIRCLITTSKSEKVGNLQQAHNTTSLNSNLASNAKWDQEYEENNIVRIDTTNINKKFESTDCQTFSTVKPKATLGLKQSSVIEYSPAKDASEKVIIQSPITSNSMLQPDLVATHSPLSPPGNAEIVQDRKPNSSTYNSSKRKSENVERMDTTFLPRLSKKTKNRIGSWFSPVIISFILCMMAMTTSCVQQKDSENENKSICRGMEIKYFDQLGDLEPCRVIEGHLIIAIIEDHTEELEDTFPCFDSGNNDCKNKSNSSNSYEYRLKTDTLSFPNLTEVTDFILLYNTKKIKTLSTLFPNLTVIRGNRLIKNFALIIYEMPNMEDIGLVGLTHILNGGVRIQHNPSLCYARNGDGEIYKGPINWRKILKNEYYDTLTNKLKSEYLMIEDNNLINQCPQICPQGCDYCWDEKSCQILETDCPLDTSSTGVCYDRGFKNKQLMRCSDQCLGGCLTKDEKGEDIHNLDYTQDECFSCKNYLSPLSASQFSDRGNHVCWMECTEGYVSYEGWRCIKQEECLVKTFTANTVAGINEKYNYKIFNGKCIEQCPTGTQEVDKDGSKTCQACKDCPKRCVPDGVISSEADLEKLSGCTEIEDDLIISSLQLSGGGVYEALVKGLGKIKVIRGSLIISRSFPIVTLDFFEDLEVIKGLHVPDVHDQNESQRRNYAIELTENENLQTLFPDASKRAKGKGNVKIRSQRGEEGQSEKGSASIHYNPKLCKKEILRLLDKSDMNKNPDPIDISFGTNGDKAICSETKLNVTIEPIHSSCDVYIQNYQEIMANNGIDTRQLLKYEMNYREITEKTYNDKSLSKHGKRDACGGSDWKIADHKPSSGNTIKQNEGTVSVKWVKEQSLIRPLNPFTYYAVYVTTMIVKNEMLGGKQDIEGAQSDIIYFRTLEYTPSKPRDIKVHRFKDSPRKIQIDWTPPDSPNGVIDHYEIEMKLRQIDEERIMQRPFCKSQNRITEFKMEEDVQQEPPKDVPEDVDGTCSCKNCDGPSSIEDTDEIARKRKINEEVAFEDALIDKVWYIPPHKITPMIDDFPMDASDFREKRDVENGRVRREVASNNKNRLSPIDENQDDVIKDKDVQNNASTDSQKETLKYGTKPVWTIYKKYIPSANTSLVVNDLRHFGQYSLKIKACHKDPDDVSRCKEDITKCWPKCSDWAKEEVQTYPDNDADDIGTVSVAGNGYESPVIKKIGGNHTTKDGIEDKQENKGEPVFITWSPPLDPNLLIVNYDIQWFTDPNETPFTTCQTAKDFNATNNRFELINTGTYTVQVRACSLAGCGKWSQGLEVSVAQKTSSYLLYVILIPVLVVVLIVTVLASGFVYVKHKASNAPEMTLNLNYHNIEDVYIVDEWEVERERVEDIGGGQEMKSKLGGGAFGVVYSGMYDCPRRGRMQVAVKTVKDNQQCRTFLGEAQVMKNFKTPHVVQLIGVVSQGTPPLVLLEMMNNGSLKEYLHSLRASKKQEERRPTEAGYLQMALEIADGMAYLSTNKEPNPIVHCDLAARNCLVTDPPVIKIGDFGMAHEVYADYYKKGNPGMMPVRWMAPETLRDGKFSSASDVWSFGVVLWEMVTLAEQPYQGMGNDGAMKYIKNGGTMEKPNECPDSIHNLMRNCWRQLPEDRPTFIDICQHLLPHSNQRFLRDSFITSNDGQRAIAEQQQSRDTQFNIMQDDSINERTQLTNIDTSSYTPSSFTDSTTAPLSTTTGNGNGNSNGNVGGGKGITDNGMPPSMGLQMHNLTSQIISPTSTNDDQSETTNGNHNEILPTTSMHDDINISLVGNDTSSSFQANNSSNSSNALLSRTLANRIRRGIRYIRSNRGQNSGIDDHAGNPRA